MIQLSRSNILPKFSLVDLPSDVITILLDYLTLDSLFTISLTCRHLHELVVKFGWASYLRSHQRTSWSLSCTETIWTPYERLRYNTVVERNWDDNDFVARPLSAPWRGNLLPVLAISDSRLVVAAGSKLDVYVFTCASRRSDSPIIRLEATYTINRSDVASQARHDVTGIAFIPDGGEDRSLLAGFADGYVMRVFLPSCRRFTLPKRELLPSLSPELEAFYRSGDIIESLSLSGDSSFTLSGSGNGVFKNLSIDASSEINIDEKSWSSYISTAGAPFVALGTSSANPLAVHSIYESALSPDASLFLSSVRASNSATPASLEASAVYGITGAPPSFPGNPGQMVVAGWYDGRVRLYDLRTPSHSSRAVTTRNRPSTTVPVLPPVLTFMDPWVTESIYAVAAGGSTGHMLAAGAARHSVVAFWDVRAPRDGWSVHAPGNDASPVYALALESSRAFGATQSRAFVLDFGAGISTETYPPLASLPPSAPRSSHRLHEGLKTTDGVHYNVTKYSHRKPMAVD
ncbi:hypothetical protein DFH11DRAFT_1877586 [Phellopilus nigrolimitatus]|nr:hypothetical protein DFH11DRAFT_1877586 [Phellopilus nigrolimitatus]